MKKTHTVNTLLYMIAPVIRNAVVFVTLPLFTRYLPPEEYGKIGLLSLLGTFVFSVFSLSLTNASGRYFFDYREDLEKLKKLFSTNFIFIFLANILGIAIVYFFIPDINKILFHGAIKNVWIIVILIYILFLQINLFHQQLLQNLYLGKPWFINEIFAVVVQYSVSITLIVFFHFKFEGIIIGLCAAEGAKFLYLFNKIKKYYTFTFNIESFKKSFQFAWPLVPVSIISFGYIAVDKIMLSIYKDLGQVGILEMSIKISIILKFVQDAVNATISPVTMDYLTKNDNESLTLLSDIFLKMTAFLCFIGLGLILFAKEAVLLLTTKSFESVQYVAPIYIYYNIFGILSIISYWFIRYPGKTIVTIPISIITLAINFTANYFLIPVYGAVGAAIATFISASVGSIVSYIIGLKYVKCPINNKKMTLIFSLVIFFTVVLYLIYYFKIGLLMGIGIKLLCVSIYVLIIVKAGIMSIQDVKMLKTSLFKS